MIYTHILYTSMTTKATLVRKSIATNFWDHKGVLLVDFLDWWHCNYSALLWYTWVASVAASRPHFDCNIRPHMTNWASDWLWCQGWEGMDHPSYSPDLMPSDLLQVPMWSMLLLFKLLSTILATGDPPTYILWSITMSFVKLQSELFDTLKQWLTRLVPKEETSLFKFILICWWQLKWQFYIRLKNKNIYWILAEL
jgi:hypothetical protein